MTESDRESAVDATLPLNPQVFSFFGFGPMPPEEERRISRLGIRRGPCTVTFVEDGLLDPGVEPGDERSGRSTGGVFDSDGLPVVAASVQRKGGKQFGPTAAVKGSGVPFVAEDVIYLGPLFNHYGRVLLETLARAWYVNEPEALSRRVVVSAANSAQGEIAGWLPPLLSAFGIPPQRLLLTDSITRFREIAVAEPLFEQSHAAHRRMVEPFHHVARNVGVTTAISDQPVYLSRQALSSRQRPIVGEAEIENILRANGVLIVCPETMSLAAQVQLFNAHHDIFSPVGSAAHTVLFAINRPRLHFLASADDIPANYFLCSALADAPTTFVNCVTSANEDSDDDSLARSNKRRGSSGRGADPFSGLQSRPQKIEIEAFVEYLRQKGVLRQAYRPLSSTEQRRLESQFDEAWAYSRLRKAAGKSTALSGEIESKIAQLAATSWPVSMMMARYFSRLRNSQRTHDMSLQFLDLIAKEVDGARFRHYRADASGIVQRLKRQVTPDVRDRLNAAIDTYWPSSASDSALDA